MSRITHDICDCLKIPHGHGPASHVAPGQCVEVRRMQPQCASTNSVEGRVKWNPVKSLWFTSHALIAIVGGCLTIGWQAMFISFVLTVTTLCLGHSIGLHRLLIHRSFACPKRLEYLLVYLGTMVGMGGPFKMLYLHDIRDWAQRHSQAHPFFIHRSPIWKDFLWQLHCEIDLRHPPRFRIEDTVQHDTFYRFLQKSWMLQQLPWAVVLWWLAGIPGVVWGICVRVTLSLMGHWMVGYFAHNMGKRDWQVEGHSVQGHNVPFLSLLTMGESWHNNHHAFPGSARLGLKWFQSDPGWWVLRTLAAAGMIWNVRTPANLPHRRELQPRMELARKYPQPECRMRNQAELTITHR